MKIFIPIIFFLALSYSVFAEIIVLKTGHAIEGQITEKTDEYIKIDVAGVPLTYYLDEVESIDGKAAATAPALKEKPVVEANSNKEDVDYNQGTFYFNRGTECLAKGNLNQAILDFTKAIEINSNDADAYINRGGAYLKKGDSDQAISDFTKAIEIKPGFAASYLNRGNAYAKKYNFDQAILDFNKAIEIDPGFGQAYYSRGFTYLLKGNIDEAVFDYNKMKELNVPVDGGFRQAIELCQLKEEIDIKYTPVMLKGGKGMTIKLQGNIWQDEQLIKDTLNQLERWSYAYNKNMFQNVDAKIIKFVLNNKSTIEEWTLRWDDGSSKKFQIKFTLSPGGGTVVVLTEDQF